MASLNPSTLSMTLFLTLTSAGMSAVSDYTVYTNTDIEPCAPPCVRVGNCGYNFPEPCNVTLIAQLCDASCGCVAFNNNGWLKGCGNTSCGITWLASSTDTYVKGGGVPIPTPDAVTVPYVDVHYPPEEVYTLLSPPIEQAVLPSFGGSGPVAVVEQTLARYGFIALVEASGGEVARLRKGVGSISALAMQNYNYLQDADCRYWGKVAENATDYLKARIFEDTSGQPTFNAAAAYMPPQRDYAIIGALEPYIKYSVAPDGRIKLADGAIWTNDTAAHDTGPGTLVWDARSYLPPGCWPATNFTFSKSSLVGRHLRVVAVTSFEPSTGNGFEQIAFAPPSEVSGNVLIRLQATVNNVTAGPSSYFNVTSRGVVSALSASSFYFQLAGEQAAWNSTLFGPHGAVYNIPGQEGARQVDMTWGSMVASMTLFVGLVPNYGDGADYWTPGLNNGGNLPFQTVNLNTALQQAGLISLSSTYLGFYFDNYIINGTYSTGTWETSCPFELADGFSDHGILLDLLSRTIRLVLGSSMDPVNASAWVQARVATLSAMSQWALDKRANATARGPPSGDPAHGLIWGPPEHDTCHEPGYYYHNQVWFIRGMLEGGKVIADVCPTLCPALLSLSAQLMTAANGLRQDLLASLNQTVTRDPASGNVTFVPPTAQPTPPFGTMIESRIAEYSNFRYYSELLGADVLPPEMAVALMNFRESHTGSVSGITRWDDHLDDMPSLHYMTSSLWYDRTPSFWMLHYGHLANYMGRGTWTATEQIPITSDENGFYRDYLWVYLEGGIDECVPSIMLAALGTQAQMVLERHDHDSVWIGKGAPSRWVDVAGPGFGVSGAVTRFGLVTFQTLNSAAGTVCTCSVVFTPSSSPGANQRPAMVVRLLSSVPGLILQPSSVQVQGEGKILGVDTGTGLVTVQLNARMQTRETSLGFTVTGSFGQ